MTGGRLLAYRETGRGDSVLVLLHGLFGNARNLGRLARELGEKHRVLALDLPGHGDSPHEQQYSITAMAARVQQTLSSLGVSSYSLLGHSLGGKVAMALALQWASEVRRLLVADIAAVRYEPRHQAVFSALASVELAAISSRAEADAVLAKTLAEPVLRQFLLQNLHREQGAYSWKFDLAGLARSYAALSDAVSAPGGTYCDAPALFVGGTASDYLLPEYEPATRQLFPEAKFQRLANAGHWLHAEQPLQFGAICEKFFSTE